MARARPRLAARHALAALSLAALGAACGPPDGQPATSRAAVLECPAPIGAIRRESCAEIADDFGGFSVSGSLKVAGSGRDAEPRIATIRAAGALANVLKEGRVALCEQYNACKVAPRDHAAKDALYADKMTKLLALWDGRSFLDPAGVERLRQGVIALQTELDGGKSPPAGAATSGAAAGSAALPFAAPPVIEITSDGLDRVESAGVTFKPESGAITASASGEGSRDVFKSRRATLSLLAGKRYLIKVTGSFTPGAPSLIAPGDEVVTRLRYRASQAGEIHVALRSLEDPDATESTSSRKVAAGDKGTHEATFTAAPGASGFYVGVGARGGTIELDDVEILRAGKLIAAARAEDAAEPHVVTSCTREAARALAGKRSFRCDAAGAGDRLTLGLPPSHLFLAVRGASGERAVVRTLSLEGGRSLDATLTEDADLVVGLMGAGAATIRTVQAREVQPQPAK